MQLKKDDFYYLMKFTYDSVFGTFYCYFSENGLYQMLLDDEIRINSKDKEIIKVVKSKDAPKKTSTIALFNFETLKKEMDLYFKKKLTTFSVLIDFSFYTEFQKKVLNHLIKIPMGKVESYKEVATKIGKPSASRAVGNAVGSNRALILIPCHRVIKSDGTSGWFGGHGNGKELKKKILLHEGVRVD